MELSGMLIGPLSPLSTDILSCIKLPGSSPPPLADSIRLDGQGRGAPDSSSDFIVALKRGKVNKNRAVDFTLIW
jgi:hypothetical protein